MSDSKKSKHSKHGEKHSGAPLSDHPALFDAVASFLRGATPIESSKRIDEAITAVGDARGAGEVFEAALRHGRLGLGLDAAWRFAFFLAEAISVAEESGEASFGSFDLNKARTTVAAECDIGVAALLAEGFGEEDSDDDDEVED